jgi:hypothetical protein
VIKQTRTVVCDICGDELDGDYAEISWSAGLAERQWQVHIPRTGAIKPCGNDVREKLDAIFAHGGRLKRKRKKRIA